MFRCLLNFSSMYIVIYLQMTKLKVRQGSRPSSTMFLKQIISMTSQSDVRPTNVGIICESFKMSLFVHFGAPKWCLCDGLDYIALISMVSPVVMTAKVWEWPLLLLLLLSLGNKQTNQNLPSRIYIALREGISDLASKLGQIGPKWDKYGTF